MMEENSPSTQEEDVRDYFERVARRFDSYYREEADTGGLIGKIAHLVFRKPAMACRFAETFAFLGELKGRNVLDAGCGSGIYSVEIAKRGGRALGVDVSQVMIDLARENARNEGVEEHCQFEVKDIIELVPGDKAFDTCLAIGFFDYIEPAKQKAVLEKMLSLVSRDVIVTFPKKWVPATFFRKVWFLTKELAVYFFTRKQVAALVDPNQVEATFVNCRSIWTVRFHKK
jgi:ubiquinone/menaquinone biosynthesis C-methylase UbiE